MSPPAPHTAPTRRSPPTGRRAAKPQHRIRQRDCPPGRPPSASVDALRPCPVSSTVTSRPLQPSPLLVLPTDCSLSRSGRPPLTPTALQSSAQFTLSLLPIRLAHRIHALRSLPFIVVSNPHISRIYNTYLHSLSTLLPFQTHGITSREDEERFTDVLADLVQSHSNTIPTLAKGFLESRRYVSTEKVTAFLDAHLRARIGTRLVAEQHIALHLASQASSPSLSSPSSSSSSPPDTYIGVIDTSLRPAAIIHDCVSFVGELCELKYGVRPSVVITGGEDATIVHVPTHLEYVLTELLKNAFRATVENGRERESVEVMIAAGGHGQGGGRVGTGQGEGKGGREGEPAPDETLTIRIRDRGGGISPKYLPHIWGYSFTTFGQDESNPSSSLSSSSASSHSSASPSNIGNYSNDAFTALSASGAGESTIAGLGYGLPLGRAYAEYFGGGIKVQSLWGWGTDVYLMLRGLGGLGREDGRGGGGAGIE